MSQLKSINFRAVTLLLLLAATVIGGHLLPGLDNSRVEDGIRNGLHLLVFAVFAVVLFEALKSMGIAKAAATAILAVALVGALSEFLQYLIGRQPDLFDVLRDVAGAALALTARLLWHRSAGMGLAGAGKYLLQSVAAAFCLAVLAPFLFWLSIVGFGRMSSPVILDFGQWWQKYTVRPINAEVIAPVSDTGSAEIQLFQRGRSGLVISPMATNWTNYKYLVITAWMIRGPDTHVTIRINDTRRRNDWSDEFMTSVVVATGELVIRVPLRELVNAPGQAEIDLSDIQELVIFARDRRKDTVMLIKDIRLE